MFDIERWQEIFETLSKNKLRTFLTGLSVASGIFILVILLGFGNGIENGVTAQFQRDATNLITIGSGVTTKEYKGLNPGRPIQMTNDNFDKISKEYEAQIEQKSSMYALWQSPITYKNETVNYRVRGVMSGQQFIENADMASGRFINQSDVENSKKVAVIGNKLKTDVFKDENPINKNIIISGVNFKVIGVFYDPGGDREEQQAYIPVSTAQKVFNGSDKIQYMEFMIHMDKNFKQAVANSEIMAKNIETKLKDLHSVAPDDISAIRIDNTLEEAQKIYSLIATIKSVFWFVGIGTIIAGIVGVGNIMLIIVKERTKEIGIRKALGAMPMSIVGMILQEAVFVTMFSGLFGLIAGLGLLAVVGPQIQSDFIKNPQVDFNIAITTVFILVIAGAVAGFIPAYRAAKIKPIVALRDE